MHRRIGVVGLSAVVLGVGFIGAYKLYAGGQPKNQADPAEEAHVSTADAVFALLTAVGEPGAQGDARAQRTKIELAHALARKEKEKNVDFSFHVTREGANLFTVLQTPTEINITVAVRDDDGVYVRVATLVLDDTQARVVEYDPLAAAQLLGRIVHPDMQGTRRADGTREEGQVALSSTDDAVAADVDCQWSPDGNTFCCGFDGRDGQRCVTCVCKLPDGSWKICFNECLPAAQ